MSGLGALFNSGNVFLHNPNSSFLISLNHLETCSNLALRLHCKERATEVIPISHPCRELLFMVYEYCGATACLYKCNAAM